MFLSIWIIAIYFKMVIAYNFFLLGVTFLMVKGSISANDLNYHSNAEIKIFIEPQ